MNAGSVLIRLTLGAMLAVTLGVAAAGAAPWPARIALQGSVFGSPDGASDQSETSGSAAGGAATDSSLQAAYQGTQQVASAYARAMQVATAQLVTLLQGLGHKDLHPGDRYTLVWSAHEQYPVSIAAASQAGFSAAELGRLARRGTWVTVRDGASAPLVVAALYSEKNNVIASLAVPLTKFTGPLDSFKLGASGRCFVLDGAGNVLNAPGGKTLDVDRGALLRMLSGDAGTLETSRYVLSFARIATPGWYLLAQVPKTEARAGIPFPSDQEIRMELPLDPPQAIVPHHSLKELLVPVGAAGGLALAGFLALLLARLRKRDGDPSGRSAPDDLDEDYYDLESLEQGLDRPMPTDRDRLGKSSRRWTSAAEDIPIKGDTPRAVAQRVQLALRHQARDHERMLAQLQHSLELTIADTRDQVHEVLNTHQGKIKALAGALDQTREQLGSRPDGEALAAVVEDLKTKFFEAESDSRTGMSGVEKRLSTLARKFADLEETLGKGITDIQDRLSEDLFGRQDEINRAMETLEARTRDVLRQVSYDAANAKVEGAKAAEIATALDTDFQELKGRFSAELDDVRRQGAADVATVRAQVAVLEDLRVDLQDTISRFTLGQAEWDERGRNLSRRVNEDLAAMQQRIFDREGDVEKLRILMDQAVAEVHEQALDLENKRQRLERDMDNLKGKVFLGEEARENLERESEARFTELFASTRAQGEKMVRFEDLGGQLEGQVADAIGDLERRFSAHISETERRASEAIAEALSGTAAKIAQLDAVREHGDLQVLRELADREERMKQILAEAEERQVAFRSELRAGRDRDDAKIAELEDKAYRAEVRMAQERTGLEDRINENANAAYAEGQAARERDLAALREEMVWQRHQEAETRQGVVEGLRAELRSEIAALRSQLNQEAATTQDSYRRIEGRMQAEAGALADLSQRTEQLVASALIALPDHPELIGLHRDIEQLSQEAYRTREDSEQFRDRVEESLRHIAEQHTEQYTKVTSLMQLLLKLYESAKESDEKVSDMLSTHATKVEGLHQEVLAIRGMVVSRPAPGAAGAPMPLL